MPDVDLHPYYFTGKHNNSARTHISTLRLPAGATDQQISDLVAAFELLSNNAVASSDLHPRQKIFSVTENVFQVKASDRVNEPYEGDSNPVGFKGFLVSDDASIPMGLVVSQPFIIENVRQDFELPTGFDPTTIPKEAIRQLINELWTVRRVNDQDEVQGLSIGSIIFSNEFDEH